MSVQMIGQPKLRSLLVILITRLKAINRVQKSQWILTSATASKVYDSCFIMVIYKKIILYCILEQ